MSGLSDESGSSGPYARPVTERIQEIVAGLTELKDVTGVWAVADERVARGDAAFAADLGVALARAYGQAEPLPWQYRSVFDHLLRLLATTAGPGNVAGAVRLVSSPEAADRKRDRYAASLLASCRRPEELVPWRSRATPPRNFGPVSSTNWRSGEWRWTRSPASRAGPCRRTGGTTRWDGCP
ncbi:DUF6183 family protein [Streptomyces albidoflavus]